MSTKKISFLAFFLIWAERMRWDVPDIHIVACHWMEHRGPLAVLRCFRGFGKSTLLGVYNAWRYHIDPEYRILHQGDTDKTAYKTSRDSKSILKRHILTMKAHRKMKGDVAFWWVPSALDERNPSMQASGIMSNITSSRADECQNDDVEVPSNISTPEAREKLRNRLSEQTHILVPGGRTLYIGTPHTHDSLYDEKERLGADCLTIRMFKHEYRIENATERTYDLPFVPDMIFSGIDELTRLLELGTDYLLEGKRVIFRVQQAGLIDFYAGSAWPERFDRAEMLKRRQATRTVNEWDSQYQLHSKPITEVRIDPERIIPYSVEPELRIANRTPTLWLGSVQIVGMASRWDPASGKLKSDVSSFALVMQDGMGRRYWHRAAALTGEVAEFSEDAKTITGGQVMQICNMVRSLNIPSVHVETNGIGTFAPAVLRAAFKQQRLRCAVLEGHSSENKNKRILEAFEPIIKSGMLWGHVSVLETVWDQMQDWNPSVKNQPDDYIDSGAGAITATPERIKVAEISASQPHHDWRPEGGVHDVALDM